MRLIKNTRFNSSVLRLTLACGVAACFASFFAPTSARAITEEDKVLSDDAATAIQKLNPLIEAKNYDAAMALMDGVLAKANKGSYDAAVANQILAQLYLQKGDAKKAVPSMEAAVASNMLDYKSSQEMTYLLAQLHYSEGDYGKAETYIKAWLVKARKVTPDALLFYSSLLYNQAVADPKSVKLDLLKQSIAQAELGLHLSSKPKTEFYTLLMAGYQLTSDYAKMADVLELLVKQYPDNKQYWPQLASIYINLQQDLRAALTIERAQKRGVMQTPKDNFNLVGIYFNMGQYDTAAETLEKGLKEGTIDNEPKNWEFLYYAYQQTHKDARALETVLRAAKNFPENGQFNFMAGQVLYGMDKLQEAFDAMKACLAKGGGDKPEQSGIFMAYVSFELKKFDDALAALDLADKYTHTPSTKKEIDRLRAGVKQAIAERETAGQKL